MRRFIRRAAVAAGLVGVGMTFAAFAAEGMARVVVSRAGSVAFIPDSVLGFRHAPQQRRWSGNPSGEFGLWFTTNAAGDPDVERTVEKASDVYRIALIGDSMLEAAQVEHAQRFGALLERALNSALPAASPYRRVEVLNFGVASYGTTQQWLQYRTHVRNYRPDAVFLMFFPPNDIRNNSHALDVVAAGRPHVAPYYTLDDAGELAPVPGDYFATARQLYGASEAAGLRGVYRRLREHSRLVQALDPLRQMRSRAPGRHALPLEAAVNRDVYRASVQDTSHVWQNAWSITEAVIRTLRTAVEADGARLHAVVLSGPAEVEPVLRPPMMIDADSSDFDWGMPNVRTQQMLTRAGVPFTNLLPPLRAARTDEPIHFLQDGHYTPAGHAAVAAQLLPVARQYIVNDRAN